MPLRNELPERGVSAHRGGAAGGPENTLAAFRCAVALGVHQVEFDVRRTSDGAIVVMHDVSIDRTTNGTGRVRDHTLAELQRLDAGGWHDVRYAGESVPTLDEALAVLPRDVWANVQIKHGEPIAADVAQLLVDSGRLDHAFLACGNSAAREARAVDAQVLVCNLVRQGTRALYVEHAIETGANFLQFHYLRGPPEPDLVERAHDHGVRVNFFCDPGSSGRDLDRLFAAGVDFVLVDDLPLALARARQVGIEPLRRA